MDRMVPNSEIKVAIFMLIFLKHLKNEHEHFSRIFHYFSEKPIKNGL